MTKENVPLYIKIIEEYKSKIGTGELKPDERLPSEIEVAKCYGVSRITSKRAFDELERERFIYRVKGRGSFVANLKISDISTNNKSLSKVIDIVLPFDSSHGRSIDIIRGANNFLQKNNYLLNIQNSHHSSAKEREILLNLYKTGVSGVIYYPISSSNSCIDLIQMLTMQNFPIVTVDKYYDGLPVTSIVADNFKGAYEAVTYLIDKGHTKIGYISDFGLDTASSVRDRFLGYSTALRDNGLEVDYNNYFLDLKKDIEKNYPEVYEIFINRQPITKKCIEYYKRILDYLMDRPDGVTAIHTVNDYVAMYMMKTAIEIGIKVPKELSFIGFDNIEISRHLEVPLTTVEQNFFGMGQKAAELLIERINGGSSETGKVVIPTRLIKRESVFSLIDEKNEITAQSHRTIYEANKV